MFEFYIKKNKEDAHSSTACKTKHDKQTKRKISKRHSLISSMLLVYKMGSSLNSFKKSYNLIQRKLNRVRIQKVRLVIQMDLISFLNKLI
jgi:hypothetical protein